MGNIFCQYGPCPVISLAPGISYVADITDITTKIHHQRLRYVSLLSQTAASYADLA